MSLAETLAEQIDGARDWTLKILADFEGEDWTFQPGSGLAHATWICGHLAVAQNSLLFQRVLERPVLDDAFIAHFKLGQPVAPADSHPYPPLDEIRRVMDQTHQATLEAVRSLASSKLVEPAPGPPHPHFQNVLGLVTHIGRHESFHTGQLATIRRLRGKTFLR